MKKLCEKLANNFLDLYKISYLFELISIEIPAWEGHLPGSGGLKNFLFAWTNKEWRK